MIRRAAGVHLHWNLLIGCALLAVGGCGEARPRTDGASAYERADTGASAAADVVRRYYDAIRAGAYDSAYALWEEGGKASGRTLREFAAGFAQTAGVRATVGDSVRVEGAAGSQYATVPVVIDAVLRNGRHQRFEGTYTLRRVMVPGATRAQHRWHIYSARLRERS